MKRPTSTKSLPRWGLKEMTQGTLIRKLCTYTQPNPTRHAIFEFDKLVRSISTLRYLRNPQLQRDVQRSQNRLESYHQLRHCHVNRVWHAGWRPARLAA